MDLADLGHDSGAAVADVGVDGVRCLGFADSGDEVGVLHGSWGVGGV